MGEACEWAAAQLRQATTNTTTNAFENFSDWTYDDPDPQKQTITTSPCGRYEIRRVRVTILSRRYSIWDKYPLDAIGLPTLAGVSDSAKGALRMINER